MEVPPCQRVAKQTHGSTGERMRKYGGRLHDSGRTQNVASRPCKTGDQRIGLKPASGIRSHMRQMQPFLGLVGIRNRFLVEKSRRMEGFNLAQNRYRHRCIRVGNICMVISRPPFTTPKHYLERLSVGRLRGRILTSTLNQSIHQAGVASAGRILTLSEARGKGFT